MKVAALFGQGLDGVIGTQEVGDQDAGEQGTEDLPDDPRPAMFVDKVVAIPFCGERPEPEGDAVDPPTGFVGVEDGAFAYRLADLLRGPFEKSGETLPGERQAPCAHPEAERDGGVFHAVPDAHADALRSQAV